MMRFHELLAGHLQELQLVTFRHGHSTTAQVPWPYFARAAAVARRDVACGGLRPLDGCVPDANGTTTGSRPRPRRVPPTGGPEARVLREQSSVALFSPTRT